ncbi:MAG: hypothetical protein LLG06_01510 [Desulfobacteraceae bacterium]|nr:hypothetical protein [Desulfobacteraceae bacterium]
MQAFLGQTPATKTLFQIRALSERSTDRFRSAQIALFSEPGLLDASGRENAMMAATAMCRAFDEMRILFQFLVESCPDRSAEENDK